MRDKRRMMLLGPALLVALALPPIGATGASAATTGSAKAATAQATQAKAGAAEVESARWCKRVSRYRTKCCHKRWGHWRCWTKHRRPHVWNWRKFGHHGKFSRYQKYDRYDKYEYRHTSRRYDHRRW